MAHQEPWYRDNRAVGLLLMFATTAQGLAYVAMSGTTQDVRRFTLALTTLMVVGWMGMIARPARQEVVTTEPNGSRD